MLEHGHKLRVVTLHGNDGDDVAAVGAALAHGVDEPADVAAMEALLAARGAL